MIDEELLIEAVCSLNAVGKPARADTLSVELGEVTDHGAHFDAEDIAHHLVELEALGRLERAAAFEWEGVGLPPKTRIAYAVPSA
jgi:hypothetical protein